jgi:hypothetical protein
LFTRARLAVPAPVGHVPAMIKFETSWRTRKPQDADGPVIDMTPDGQFTQAPTPMPSPLAARVIGLAVLVAVLAGALAVALLALWLALQLIPIAIGAGLIAYGAFRFQLWRARQSSLTRQSSLSGQRNPVRR